MTLEDIKKDMKTLNEDLVAIGMALDFKENEWEEYTVGMINRILEDESVKAILLTGTPEERKEYLEVIKTGMQKGIEVLKERSIELHDSGKTDKEVAFNNVTIRSEQLADTIIKMEAIENDEEEFVISDEERIEDLERKIYYIDSTLELVSKFEELEKEIPLKSGKSIQDETKKSLSELKTEFSMVEAVRELRQNGHRFLELLKEMNELSFENKIDMTNEEQKSKIDEMVKLAGKIDKVDWSDKDVRKVPYRDRLNLSNPKYEDKKRNPIDRNDAVEIWLSKLNVIVENEEKLKMLNMDPEFLNDREKIIKEKFLDFYKDSWIAKELTPEMHKKVLEEKDFNVEELEKSIVDLSERLNQYKNLLSKKNPEELLEYKKQAEKLLKNYKTVANGSKNITINGKAKQLETDMTDITKKYDAVDEILKLEDDDEFKKEINSKAMVLAGDRPTDKWYHKFVRFITFGRYKTPEDKYEIKLYVKKADIIGDLIKENKTNMDEAVRNVEYDKFTYKQTAREKVYKDKDKDPNKKKFNKKQVLRTRDNSQPLTR